MKTPVCKEWASVDTIKGSSESAMNQSHRDVTRCRSRSPQRWRGKTSGEVADMIGPSSTHNATGCQNTHSINLSLEPNNGKASVTAHSVSKQSIRRSRDPRLVASLHTRPVQQEPSMIQPTVSPSWRVTILKIAIDPRDGLPLLLSHSVELTSHDPATHPVSAMISIPSGVPIHTFRVATDPSNGHSVILSHTVDEVTGHAANSVVDPSNSTKGQPSGSDVRTRETHDDNQTEVLMLFKTTLKEFVTKQIDETRDQAQSTKELRDFIMQKTVANIMHSEKNFPSTEERIGKYLSFCKGKIKKTYTGILSQVRGKISSVKFVESKRSIWVLQLYLD